MRRTSSVPGRAFTALEPVCQIRPEGSTRVGGALAPAGGAAGATEAPGPGRPWPDAAAIITIAAPRSAPAISPIGLGAGVLASWRLIRSRKRLALCEERLDEPRGI